MNNKKEVDIVLQQQRIKPDLFLQVYFLDY